MEDDIEFLGSCSLKIKKQNAAICAIFGLMHGLSIRYLKLIIRQRTIKYILQIEMFACCFGEDEEGEEETKQNTSQTPRDIAGNQSQNERVEALILKAKSFRIKRIVLMGCGGLGINFLHSCFLNEYENVEFGLIDKNYSLLRAVKDDLEDVEYTVSPSTFHLFFSAILARPSHRNFIKKIYRLSQYSAVAKAI